MTTFSTNPYFILSNVSSVILNSLSRNCFTIKSQICTSIKKSVITYINTTVTNISNNNKTILQHNKNIHGLNSALTNSNQFFTEDMLMIFLFYLNQLNNSQNFKHISIHVILICLFHLSKK